MVTETEVRAAQASAGRLLYDTAGGDAAALLEGSRLCCTRQLRNLLPCLGGVAVLLPLLEQLGARAGAAPLCLSGAGGRVRCGLARLYTGAVQRPIQRSQLRPQPTRWRREGPCAESGVQSPRHASIIPLPERCADAPAGDGGAEEPSRAVAVLQLLAAVLEDSPSNRQSLAQLSGAPP